MQVTERFLKYVSFDTTSSETSDTVPTTAHQKAVSYTHLTLPTKLEV